jgi:hypothetical protein|tara:strand:- start:4287 stop:4475 length:189 start_codon:yes stop_codon:yes gene_type:complete
MERGLIMLMHSLVIGLVGYFIMLYVLKQSPAKAENRSILLVAIMAIYMVLFGHGLPTTNINI